MRETLDLDRVRFAANAKRGSETFSSVNTLDCWISTRYPAPAFVKFGETPFYFRIILFIDLPFATMHGIPRESVKEKFRDNALIYLI